MSASSSPPAGGARSGIPGGIPSGIPRGVPGGIPRGIYRGILRGIEILVKKAAVDHDFREALLAERADAAKRIGLDLAPAEAAMLAAIPPEQLEAIVDGTRVTPKQRRAFLGKAAAVMIAALGVTGAGCEIVTGTRGVRPDRPPPKRSQPAEGESAAGSPEKGEVQ